jgi:hypothetical protein
MQVRQGLRQGLQIPSIETNPDLHRVQANSFVSQTSQFEGQLHVLFDSIYLLKQLVQVVFVPLQVLHGDEQFRQAELDKKYPS